MKYYLCQIIHFLFCFQLITIFLGTAFFYIIQKIRYKYKQSLPTSFHCILLKISLTYFFVPNTIILYAITYIYYSTFSPIPKNALNEPCYSFSIFQFFILIIGTIGTFKEAARYIKLSRQLKQYITCISTKVTEHTINNLSFSIQKRYGLKRQLPIYVHPYIPSPSIAGILHPKILLPKDIFQKAAPETLQIILSHEILHYQKKDIFWYYFSIIIQCIYWYLPSVKTLCIELKNWLEYECDELCCKKNEEQFSKQDYFNTILDLSYNEKRNTVGLNFYKNRHQIEKRIQHMHSKKRIIEMKAHFCLFLLFVLLCIYFFSLMFSFIISFYLF